MGAGDHRREDKHPKQEGGVAPRVCSVKRLDINEKLQLCFEGGSKQRAEASKTYGGGQLSYRNKGKAEGTGGNREASGVIARGGGIAMRRRTDPDWRSAWRIRDWYHDSASAGWGWLVVVVGGGGACTLHTHVQSRLT